MASRRASSEDSGVLVLGPNGAGKSTLLQLLAGQMRPRGVLRYREMTFPQAQVALRREVGWIAAAHQGYAALTVRENLALHAALRGVPSPKRTIDEALEAFQLLPLQRMPLGALSTGLVRRLALARMLLHRPSVLLLDEPYSGLDLQGQLQLDALLRQHREQGGTCVLITHQFASGVALCDTLWGLRNGELVLREPGLGGQLDPKTYRSWWEKLTAPASEVDAIPASSC